MMNKTVFIFIFIVYFDQYKFFKVLQSATTKTPVKPKDTSEKDLAFLIKSLDLTTPAKEILSRREVNDLLFRVLQQSQ